MLVKYYSIFTQILITEQRRSLSRMRAAMMTAASLALTMTVLGNAWSQRQQFYPSVVYITKSNPSMAVIYLQVDWFIICREMQCFHLQDLCFLRKEVCCCEYGKKYELQNS